MFAHIALATAAVAVQTDHPRGFLAGGDVSEIPEVVARGGVYTDQGKPEDPFQILRRAGWNAVRLRVWNDPADGFCNKDQTLRMAKRVKAAGMALSIDFHYSDSWADPAHQTKPKAWQSLSVEELAESVRNYTRSVVGDLVKQGTPPVMVQIGNEIIGGMLWPEGKLAGNDAAQWKTLAKLVNAGVEGVRLAQGRRKILTMVHLDRGGSNVDSRWWLDHALKAGMSFDTIGQSYYPWWHGPLVDLEANITDLVSRYKKDVYIVEVAYPWTRDPARGPGFAYDMDLKTEFPATPQGQADFLSEVMRIAKRSGAKGVLYWAPSWISTKGTHINWSNMALFDDAGRALPGLNVIGSVRRQTPRHGRHGIPLS